MKINQNCKKTEADTCARILVIINAKTARKTERDTCARILIIINAQNERNTNSKQSTTHTICRKKQDVKDEPPIGTKSFSQVPGVDKSRGPTLQPIGSPNLVDFRYGQTKKSTRLGPCENRLYWDPARRHSHGQGPALGPGWDARPRAGPAPPIRVPGSARAQGCASEPGPKIFLMVPK